MTEWSSDWQAKQGTKGGKSLKATGEKFVLVPQDK